MLERLADDGTKCRAANGQSRSLLASVSVPEERRERVEQREDTDQRVDRGLKLLDPHKRATGSSLDVVAGLERQRGDARTRCVLQQRLVQLKLPTPIRGGQTIR